MVLLDSDIEVGVLEIYDNELIAFLQEWNDNVQRGHAEPARIYENIQLSQV